MPYGYDPYEKPCWSCRIIVTVLIGLMIFGMYKLQQSVATEQAANKLRPATERTFTWEETKEYCASKGWIVISGKNVEPACVPGEYIYNNPNLRQYFIEKEKNKK